MIQLIVEGQGEERSVPKLIGRLLNELGVYGFAINRKPIRLPRTQLRIKERISQALEEAKFRKIKAVIFIHDLDGDCARDVAPYVRDCCSNVAPDIKVAVVLARREYEAWFLAAIDSLRGLHGVASDAKYETNPELKRDAKGLLKGYIEGRVYSETVDQFILTGSMNLEIAFKRSSSFRKLTKELCRIAAELGHNPVIPDAWQDGIMEWNATTEAKDKKRKAK